LEKCGCCRSKKNKEIVKKRGGGIIRYQVQEIEEKIPEKSTCIYRRSKN